MKVYVVRNQEGKYFRPKGMDSYRSNWVEELDKAKIYPKIGQAKGRVTYFSNRFPDFGRPEILEFTLDNPVVVEY